RRVEQLKIHLTDRSQRRADPHPRDAARARSGQQDRQLHGVARPRFAGFSGQHGGAARRNLRAATQGQRRPVWGRGDRAPAYGAAADRSQRHDAHGGLLSISAHAAGPRTNTRRRDMLPDSALKSMRVMFATHCYISGVSMNYVASIFSLTLDSAHFGLPCILHLHSESLITRGRNKIVIKFLSEESLSHLFWIDSDIAF